MPWAQTQRLCAVVAYSCLVALILFCLYSDPVEAQGRCCNTAGRRVPRVRTETYYIRRSSGYSYSCGFWGWSRCRGTRYHYARHTRTRRVYVTEYYRHCNCCPGYQRIGGICRPICVPPCVNGVCDWPDTCTCEPGWTDRRCRIDINECENNGGCEQNCTNSAGSYSCMCGDGYTLSDDGRQCDDINECEDGNNGGCTHNCTNTRGSYQCTCRLGYEFQREEEGSGSGSGSSRGDATNTGMTVDPLTDAGRPCQDINECAVANGGCEHNCINTEGSFYCGCREGFVLENNGLRCKDATECTTGQHNCTENATCMEEVGFFRCVCPAGYQIDEDTYASCKVLADLPPLGIRFIRGSPRVNGSTVEAEFTLTRPAYSITCQISRYRELNCSSGSVSFTDLAPGRYVLQVAATNSEEDWVIERRRFEISSDPSFCTTHLINGGVTVRGSTVTVEFAGTGPAEMFSCRLDTEPAFVCTSPVEVTELTAGEHSLKIVPQGCGKNRRQQNVEFTI